VEGAGRALNVNELRAVHNVIKLIADDKSPQSNNEEVFVPDENTCLVSVKSCVFNDSPWIARRIDHSMVPRSSCLCFHTSLFSLRSLLPGPVLPTPCAGELECSH
jgi:hypothetical protein